MTYAKSTVEYEEESLEEVVVEGLRDNTPNAARLMEALRHITIGLAPKKQYDF